MLMPNTTKYDTSQRQFSFKQRILTLPTYKKSQSRFSQTSLEPVYISLLVILHTAFSAESENVALSLQKPAEHLQHLLTRRAYIRQRLHMQTVISNHQVSKQFGLLYIYTVSLSKSVWFREFLCNILYSGYLCSHGYQGKCSFFTGWGGGGVVLFCSQQQWDFSAFEIFCFWAIEKKNQQKTQNHSSVSISSSTVSFPWDTHNPGLCL